MKMLRFGFVLVATLAFVSACSKSRRGDSTGKDDLSTSTGPGLDGMNIYDHDLGDVDSGSMCTAGKMPNTCANPISDSAGCGPTELCGTDGTGNGLDDNCDGHVDEDCPCTPGNVEKCFAGPPGKHDIGACTDGTATCQGTEFGAWGPCVGSIGPSAEVCDGTDNDCNGCADDGLCCGDTLACPTMVPDVQPYTNVTYPGSTYFTGSATSWTWKVTGGPCDQLFATTTGNPAVQSFTVTNGTTSMPTANYTLSGDYTVVMTANTGSGAQSCTFVQHVAGPGIRFELCWDTTGSSDLDLHLHKPNSTTNFFGTTSDYSDAFGDLIDLSNMAYTVGARGSGRMTGHLFKQPQELEVGYFLRGDFGTSLQQRIEAATNVPYHTDTNLDWKLGDIGLYADANLRATSWLAVRGGLRADFFTYDVNNLCAVQTTPDYPAPMSPQDASCLSQQNFGAYREPNQHSTSVGIAYQPRASLVIGPWKSLGATVSYGKGARSIDPVYITGDNHQEPFASTQSVDAGVSYARQLRYFLLSATGTFFRTGVSQDLIFSQTAGRNILGGASTRIGTAETFRITGSFYDLAANFTYVDAYFDGPDPTQPNSPAHPLVPYIPDIVFRFDGAIHGEIPIKKLRLWRRPFFGSLAAGITYVAPRPLPQDQRGDAIFTVDLNARLGWWIFELGVSATNLLDSKYKLNSYNYVSDFHTQGTYQPLVPSQMFAAGPPLTVLGTLTVHIGGNR
jgi:hypothetical protein